MSEARDSLFQFLHRRLAKHFVTRRREGDYVRVAGLGTTYYLDKYREERRPS